MANPWEIEWASNADPIIAPPDPYKARADARADASLGIQQQNANMQQQLNELKVAEMTDKRTEKEAEKGKADDADERAAYKLMKAISQMQRVALDANDNGGFMETGASGSFSRTVLPAGTAAYDLAGDLKTLDANFAFDALQAMRDASKTGGALGAITERELDLLKSSVENLDPNLSHETFLANVERARQAYLSKLAMLNPEVATQLGYDSTKAEEGFMALNEEYNKQFGGGPIAVDRSTSNRPPADIEAIMAKYGAR